MEGLLFFRVYPSDGFRFILIPDGNPSHEFPILDGNPSSNMNAANGSILDRKIELKTTKTNNVTRGCIILKISCTPITTLKIPKNLFLSLQISKNPEKFISKNSKIISLYHER